MSEGDVQNRARLAASKLGLATLFRNNVGVGWAGKSTRLSNGDVLIKNPRPLRAGLCVGSGDTIGWRAITITQEMVGRQVAVFVSAEFKTKTGRIDPDQLHFAQAVTAAGGIGCIVRSPEELVAALEGYK
jgi:hypothetical protein